MSGNLKKHSKQEIYRNMLVGILLYSVVLGFFNDYTHFLHTSSYSVTFALAIVMQILTFLTFMLKDYAKKWFKKRDGSWVAAGLVFTVWLILFLSKFVFLAVISFVFRDEVYISGFIGLLLIVVSLTIIQSVAELIDRKLSK